ncbi:unnamed protein product [Absidia cylindrospora]
MDIIIEDEVAPEDVDIEDLLEEENLEDDAEYTEIIGELDDPDLLEEEANDEQQTATPGTQTYTITNNDQLPAGTTVSTSAVPSALKMQLNIPDNQQQYPRQYRIPPSFYNAPSIALFFFLGFFGGDGVSSSTSNLIGIGLRSTEFPFLLDLLYNVIGLTLISFRFVISNILYANGNGGLFGGVKWIITDGEFKRYLSRTGMAGSKIKNSNMTVLRNFMPPDMTNRRLYFAVWLLGFIMADGSVSRHWSGSVESPSIVYGSIEITLRDGGMLAWISDMMGSFGCNVSRSYQIEQHGRQYHRLYLRGLRTKMLLLDGLRALDEAGINTFGKLTMLEDLLCRVALPESIANRAFGCRQSYRDFIGALHGELNLSTVAGLDIYSLQLYEVNDLLVNAFGMPPLTSIWQFNLEEFTNTMVQSTVTDPTNTNFGILMRMFFVQYWTSRQRDEEQLNEKLEGEAHPFKLCLHCDTTMSGIQYALHRPGTVPQQVPFEHANINQTTIATQPLVSLKMIYGPRPQDKPVRKCPNPQCQRLFKTNRLMLEHYINRHLLTEEERLALKIPCRGCNEQRSEGQVNYLAAHYREAHQQPRDQALASAHADYQHHLQEHDIPTWVQLKERCTFHLIEHHVQQHRPVSPNIRVQGATLVQAPEQPQQQEQQYRNAARIARPNHIYAKEGDYYVCPYRHCQYRNIRPKDLEHHMQREHVKTVEEVNLLSVPCVSPTCHVTFYSSHLARDFRSHVRKRHQCYFQIHPGTDTMQYFHRLVANHYAEIGTVNLEQQLLSVRHTLATLLGRGAENPILESTPGSRGGLKVEIWDRTRDFTVDDVPLVKVSDVYAAANGVLHCRYDTCTYTTNASNHLELHMLFKHRKTVEEAERMLVRCQVAGCASIMYQDRFPVTVLTNHLLRHHADIFENRDEAKERAEEIVEEHWFDLDMPSLVDQFQLVRLDIFRELGPDQSRTARLTSVPGSDWATNQAPTVTGGTPGAAPPTASSSSVASTSVPTASSSSVASTSVPTASSSSVASTSAPTASSSSVPSTSAPTASSSEAPPTESSSSVPSTSAPTASSSEAPPTESSSSVPSTSAPTESPSSVASPLATTTSLHRGESEMSLDTQPPAPSAGLRRGVSEMSLDTQSPPPSPSSSTSHPPPLRRSTRQKFARRFKFL